MNIQADSNILVFSWYFETSFLCQITRGLRHSIHPTVQGHHHYAISKIVSADRNESPLAIMIINILYLLIK